MRFNTYAEISQIRCPRNFASCHGPGYRTKKEPETFGSADKYSCFGAAGLQEIQYFPSRASFRQPQTGVTIARGSISWIAVRELGYSGADVARYLGVTNSCVTRFVASGQKPDVDDLIKKL